MALHADPCEYDEPWPWSVRLKVMGACAVAVVVLQAILFGAVWLAVWWQHG